jgi:hypothetical protein
MDRRFGCHDRPNYLEGVEDPNQGVSDWSFLLDHLLDSASPSSVYILPLATDNPYNKRRPMGWGRTLLLGNIETQLNIDDVEADVGAVRQHLEMQRNADATQDQAIDRLQQENHELKIYIATLLRLLLSKNILTDDELSKFVDLLDPR